MSHEVRDDPTELRADDLSRRHRLDEVLEPERRVSRIQLELDLSARRGEDVPRLRGVVGVFVGAAILHRRPSGSRDNQMPERQPRAGGAPCYHPARERRAHL